jgi:hypothetical protein
MNLQAKVDTDGLPPRTRRIFWLIVLIGIANFLACFAISLLIGGDALNGAYKDGHFFLSNHGRLTEVAHWVFLYSKIHTLSLFITVPLAGLCWCFLCYDDHPRGRAARTSCGPFD